MFDQLNQSPVGDGNTPEQDAGGNDGGAQQTQQDVIETLAAYGVPDDVLSQVKGATLRQDDYTRKTQEVAETRRALELQQQQINQIAAWALQQSQAANGQNEPATNFDRVWQEVMKDSDETQAQPIRKLFEAKEADIAARMRQTELQLAQYQAKDAFQQEYETSVKPMFGSHLDAVWKEAERLSMNELMQGRVVSPLAVISQLAPEKLLEAAQKSASEKQRTGLPPEGMVNLRHEQPIVGGKAQPKGDPSSTENILREVQAMMRGRLSA